MQHGICKVRLSGDLNNQIPKDGVTPAEILLLRSIHGGDAVAEVQSRGNDKRTHSGEIQRLRDAYGEKVVAAAFPGLSPTLPVAFKDIGIDAPAVIAAEIKAERGARKARVPLGERAPGPAQDEEGGDDDGGDAGGEGNSTGE